HPAAERPGGRVPPEAPRGHRPLGPGRARRRDGRTREHGGRRDTRRVLRGRVFRAGSGAGQGPRARPRERCRAPLRAWRRSRGGRRGDRARGELPTRNAVRVHRERVASLLGYFIAEDEMHAILRRLSCIPESDGSAMRVTPPSWRFDLAIEEDFVEEIARVHGYDHVPAKPPRASVPMLRLREGERTRFDVRHRLADLGYQEIASYSFVPEEWERDFAANADPVRLANPIASTMSVMRTSLLGGLVQALRAN